MTSWIGFILLQVENRSFGWWTPRCIRQLLIDLLEEFGCPLAELLDGWEQVRFVPMLLAVFLQQDVFEVDLGLEVFLQGCLESSGQYTGQQVSSIDH